MIENLEQVVWLGTIVLGLTMLLIRVFLLTKIMLFLSFQSQLELHARRILLILIVFLLLG